MIFIETQLEGALVIELERREDQRGFFARSFCQQEFAEHGLEVSIAQANVSYSRERGTLRGMHYQAEPFAETKYVRCTRGAVFDVIVDLRHDSPTYCQWASVELSAKNHRTLYVPRGFAHGFQTLRGQCEVTYLVSSAYSPAHERGVRYNDPAFEIEWPLAVQQISDKDSRWGDFQVLKSAPAGNSFPPKSTSETSLLGP